MTQLCCHVMTSHVKCPVMKYHVTCSVISSYCWRLSPPPPPESQIPPTEKHTRHIKNCIKFTHHIAYVFSSKNLESRINTALHGVTLHDVTWRDVTWCDMTLHDMTWHDLTWRDVTWCDMTWHYATFSITNCFRIYSHVIPSVATIKNIINNNVGEQFFL